MKHEGKLKLKNFVLHSSLRKRFVVSPLMKKAS